MKSFKEFFAEYLSEGFELRKTTSGSRLIGHRNSWAGHPNSKSGQKDRKKLLNMAKEIRLKKDSDSYRTAEQKRKANISNLNDYDEIDKSSVKSLNRYLSKSKNR